MQSVSLGDSLHKMSKIFFFKSKSKKSLTYFCIPFNSLFNALNCICESTCFICKVYCRTCISMAI